MLYVVYAVHRPISDSDNLNSDTETNEQHTNTNTNIRALCGICSNQNKRPQKEKKNVWCDESVFEIINHLRRVRVYLLHFGPT